jgi:hypothetical protein
MKIGSIRRFGRRMLVGAAAGAAATATLAAALTVTPSTLVAQTAPELSLLRALGDHYELPPDEVAILAEWRIPVAEIPVALAIADNAGISPDAIVASRRNGREWAALAGRYGLDMQFFHVPLDPVPEPVSSLYADLATRPRAAWGEVVPTDAQVVFLTNVRFLHEYVGISESAAAAALVEHGSAAEALRAISP